MSASTIYRKVEIHMWSDRKFRALSGPPPNAQTLWSWLLTGPRTTIFPGLVVATPQMISGDLKWPLDATLGISNQGDIFGEAFATRDVTPSRGSCRGTRDAIAELVAANMIRVDQDAGLIVLHRALFTGDSQPRESAKPGSANHIRGWVKQWKTIPECDLKDAYLQELQEFAFSCSEAIGHAMVDAFQAFLKTAGTRPRTPGRRVANASRTRRELRNRIQEQDLDPEYVYPGEPRAHDPTPPEPSSQHPSNLVPFPALGKLGSADIAPVAPESPLRDLASQSTPEVQIARTGLARSVWRKLNALRASIARDLGQPAPQELPELTGGWVHLHRRIAEASTLAQAQQQLEHVLAVAAAEATHQHRSVRYLTGDAMFKSTEGYNPWEAKLGTSVADVSAPKASPAHHRRPPQRVSAFSTLDSTTDLVEAALEQAERGSSD